MAASAAGFVWLRPRLAAPPPPAADRLASIVTLPSGESYFVPSEAPPGPRPAILLLDPKGNAPQAVHRYARSAARHGVLLAASTAIRGGTSDTDDERTLRELVAGLSERASLDMGRVAIGGFSGGGTSGYGQALRSPDLFRGAIVECGHMAAWRQYGSRADGRLSFYLFTRAQDFNRSPTHELATAMRARHLTVEMVEGQGEHAPMGDDDTERAVVWMLDRMS